MSVHAASDTASCPPAWRLFLPESWDGPDAAGRREACRIPEDEHHQPKWRLALGMLDELAGLGLRPAALVADAGYGANADFRHGLEDRGPAYVLQVKGEMTPTARALNSTSRDMADSVPNRCRATGPVPSPYASTCWPSDGNRGGPWSGARGPRLR
ncbi:transposase [Streptomyces sp. NPDC051366]|uniref:transposase n=1 Tax=Streptomyces sp. NPDC051366 TaxID=3365652 RepID=UPI0037B90D38